MLRFHKVLSNLVFFLYSRIVGFILEGKGIQMEEINEMNLDEMEQDTLIQLREQRRQKKRKNSVTLAVVGCTVLLLTLLTGSVFLYLWWDKSLQEEEARQAANMNVESVNSEDLYSKEELADYIEEIKAQARQEGAQEVLLQLEEGLNSSTGLVGVLRELYDDKLVVASSGKYHFIPINPNMKQHSYVTEELAFLSDGSLEYIKDGQVISHKGIDVSKHQGEIDWAKVASDGVEFAFIRVGNRGYGTGAIVEDAQFEANIKGALSNGIQVGVYFFSQAINEEEAMDEAQFVLEKIAPYKIQCPVVIDVEKVSDSEARMNQISLEQRTSNTLVFLETVEAAGYEVMLYHNMEMGTLMLDMEQFEDYSKWFAYYNKEIYYPYVFDVWQYSDKGKVDGITGDVDLNISFKLWD